jgi:hypothetical protein
MLLTGTSFAGISDMEPASVLVYPYYNSDTTRGYETLISVTNVNTCMVYNPGTDKLFGDVWVHFNYVDKDNCDISDIGALLTPFDTLCVQASKHNPTATEGWLYVVCQDPNTQLLPIKFDGELEFGGGALVYDSGIIGDVVVVDSVANYLWAIPAIGIKAYWSLEWGQWTDRDGDGKLDFGPRLGPFEEYEGLPTSLYISSFIDMALPSKTSLVILTFLGIDVRVDMNFQFHHNNEMTEFSQGWDFRCWDYKLLTEIWDGADDLENYGGITDYYSPVVTGWASMKVTGGVIDTGGGYLDPDEIPILGMIIHQIGTSTYQSAHILHHTPDCDVKGELSPHGS